METAEKEKISCCLTDEQTLNLAKTAIKVNILRCNSIITWSPGPQERNA